MAKRVVLCGAGKYGRDYMELIGGKNILCFVDKNESLQKSGVEGVPVKSYDDLFNLYEPVDVIISAGMPWNAEIATLLTEKNISFYPDYESYFLSKRCKERWKDYYGIHQGESCFLIGSGPSLLADDLVKIQKKGITTFAPNKIFKLFDQTTWRPDYYVVTDRRIINHYQQEITNVDLKNKFIAYYHNSIYKSFYQGLTEENSILFKMKEELENGNFYEFSTDVSDYVVEGRTVIYAMMQIAVYMGFKNIYLIGVDFSYSDTTGYDKNNKDHFCNNYIEKGEEVLITPREYALKAFESGAYFGENNEICIKNATRGGMLEVYERVDLDDFLKG